MTNWYVYIVRCSDGSLYTGITTNLERRVAEHNSGGPKGARYTRARRPVKLVYQENQTSRSAASKQEFLVRNLSKTDKELLTLTCPGLIE
jgi:putative endonuclease